MTREHFLTVRWNNILSAGLGIPTLIYVIFAFSTLFWLERYGLIGLIIFGVLLCIGETGIYPSTCICTRPESHNDVMTDHHIIM